MEGLQPEIAVEALSSWLSYLKGLAGQGKDLSATAVVAALLTAVVGLRFAMAVARAALRLATYALAAGLALAIAHDVGTSPSGKSEPARRAVVTD